MFEKHLHRSSEIRQLITNDVDSPVSVNSDSTSNVQSIEPVDTYSSAEIDNLLEISNGLINGQTSTLILVPYVVRILLYY